jgi:hypothetical protein
MVAGSFVDFFFDAAVAGRASEIKAKSARTTGIRENVMGQVGWRGDFRG